MYYMAEMLIGRINTLQYSLRGVKTPRNEYWRTIPPSSA